MKKREGNYDLLRIVSTVLVIMIHVASSYVGAFTSNTWNGNYDITHLGYICVYNMISRFAVPCFVMLSGAFVLANEKNSDYKYFYKKTFRNIGIPTLIFSCLYFVYSEILEIVRIVPGMGTGDLFAPVKNWITGAPFYHMWYLYMMIGVYVLAPIVIKLKRDIGEKYFERVVWGFLFVAMLSALTNAPKLHWDIGKSFCYLGYFMAGYVLRRKVQKSNIKGALLIAGGIVTELLTSVLFYYLVQAAAKGAGMRYHAVQAPFFPLIVLASLLIFAGFSALKIEHGFGRLPETMFYVYLFHGGVWNLVDPLLVRRLGEKADARILIPLSVAAVFFISLCLSYVYQYIVKRFCDRKIRR